MHPGDAISRGCVFLLHQKDAFSWYTGSPAYHKLVYIRFIKNLHTTRSDDCSSGNDCTMDLRLAGLQCASKREGLPWGSSQFCLQWPHATTQYSASVLTVSLRAGPERVSSGIVLRLHSRLPISTYVLSKFWSLLLLVMYIVLTRQ